MSKRYAPEYDQVVRNAISLTGKDSSAWETLGVSHTSFYIWVSRHESFRAAVEQGREFYRTNSPEMQRLALISYISAALQNGGEEIRIRTTQTVTVREIRRDRNNQVIGVTDTQTTVETDVTENRGLPKWVADKVMANAVGLNEAVIKVLAAGYEIHRPNALPPAEDSQNVSV